MLPSYYLFHSFPLLFLKKEPEPEIEVIKEEEPEIKVNINITQITAILIIWILVWLFIDSINLDQMNWKVIDPKKSPFLSPTPCLVISFDVKLTDSCWASEIYQVGKVKNLYLDFPC